MLKRWSLVGLLVCGCNQGGARTEPGTAQAAPPAAEKPAKEAFGELTVAEVETRRKQPNVFVYDNNPKEVFTDGHLPGARWVNPSTMTATDLPADKEATLIFYCANEHWTSCHKGAGGALKLGFKKVFVMPAGIKGWKAAGLPVEKAA